MLLPGRGPKPSFPVVYNNICPVPLCPVPLCPVTPSRTIPMPDPASSVLRLRFRRAPLAAAATWFALGILASHVQLAYTSFTPVPLLLGALILLAAVALAALRPALRIAWLPVAALWLLLGFAAAQWQPAPATSAALMPFADNLSRTVRGHVIRLHPAPQPTPEAEADADPIPPWESTEDTPASAAHSSFDLALDSIEQVTPDTSALVPISGGIRISLYDPGAAALILHCGDRLELPLRLKPAQRFRDPGVFQYSGYLLTQGIDLQSSVAASRVQLLDHSPPALRCRLIAAQTWASQRLLAFAASPDNQHLPRALRLDQADALMLNAMLFGDRTGLTHPLRTGFERTGTFHLFVVSGLHIALLAAGVFWLLRRLRAPPWLATLLTIALAAAYAALTGFGQPAQRALVMTSVYLLARLLSRSGAGGSARDPINALGAAVLALLIWSPSSLFDASFQMTALVILAIGGIAIPLSRRTFLRFLPLTRQVFDPPHPRPDPRASQFILMLELWGETVASLLGPWSRQLPALFVRALFWTLELALISIVAELVMTLPMAAYFHRAALFGVPANLIVLPVVAFLATAALATFLCALLSPWLALIPAAVTAFLLHGVTWIIHRISHLSAADVRLPGPAPSVALLAIAAWCACCWLVRRSRPAAVAAALALPLLAALVLWPEPPVTSPGTLEITAIDVGQGDSLLAVNPDGRTMLIDAGGPVGRHGPAEIVAGYDIGEQVVAPYLWSRRLRRLDILVLTHAHTDHMGGMPAILADFRPRELWVPANLAGSPRSALFAALLAQAARLGILVRHLQVGDRLPWGPVNIEALSPTAAYANSAAPRNDDSLVLELHFGQASALLEGDAETSSEQAMLAAALIHPVTLLKVGHHGSRTSTTQPFLDAAAPTDAVISVGRLNTFGHPRAEVIARLAARHTHLFRTDLFGLTTFFLTSDGRIRESVAATPLAPHP